ncbi:MAG: rod-binding protein [Alphaproteobacteria bacterium]|nr:rod-binding protein [Alphaproteobacteria bacterium]
MDAISALPDTTDILGSPAALSMKLGPTASMAQIDKTSQDFEAMFATQLLQPMFEGIGVDPTFGGGHGEEVMKSFMLQEYGKLVAKSGKLGIASHVKAEMLRAQEGGRSPSPARASAAYAQKPMPVESADVAQN